MSPNSCMAGSEPICMHYKNGELSLAFFTFFSFSLSCISRYPVYLQQSRARVCIGDLFATSVLLYKRTSIHLYTRDSSLFEETHKAATPSSPSPPSNPPQAFSFHANPPHHPPANRFTLTIYLSHPLPRTTHLNHHHY
ncbi:hypothetical protein N7G274_002639 [Stereocaulon virgatum]|uniref:Uncharacterized protein n=1 Tax=Stereocaulon virgatum TaxID=373712 RepID=A0ABR4AGD0_9LECA